MNAPSSAPPAPRPLSPITEATDSAPRITFRWDTVPDATSYDLQVATRSDFSQRLLDTTVQPTSSFMPKQPLPAQTPTLYWRVRAQRADGPTAWSATQTITPSTDGRASIPVRHSHTSTRFALIWVGLILVSFGFTIALLYWLASQMA